MITVYGSSDDLIEVEGSIREEFYTLGEPNYLGFSNGVVLKITYDHEGMWRIAPLMGVSQVEVEFLAHDEYSDVAKILTDASWVVHGSSWAKR